MAADYEFYNYVDGKGVNRKIRAAVAGALAQTTTAVAFTTSGALGSVEVGGNRNRIGLHARGVRLKRATGTGAAKKSFFTFLPIFLIADWNALSEGDAISVGGTAYTVSSKVPEKAV
jgi:hypothetical protein